MSNSSKSSRTLRAWTHLPWKDDGDVGMCFFSHCQSWEEIPKFIYENTLEFMFAVLPAGQFTPLQISSSSEPLGIRDEVQFSCLCPIDGTVQISMVPQRSPWGPEKKPRGFISFFVLGQMMSIQCLLQILYKKSFLNLWILYKGWSAPQVKEHSSPVIFLLGWKTPRAPSIEQDF